MTAVAAGEAEVLAALRNVDGVWVAAVNGPSSVVISGDADAVQGVAEGFRVRGVRVKGLRVSHAFHSHRMDPVLAGRGGGAARVPWACGLTGELATRCEAGYWVRQAREPVRWADAVAALAGQEISVFLEIGPDGTLSALGPAALGREDGEGDGAVFVPVLRPGQPAPVAVTTALARAHVHGAPVAWTAVLGGGQRVDLPTYAFQHQRFWPQPRQVPVGGDGVTGSGTAAEARFWTAVEGGDLQALSQTLAVQDRQRLGEVLPALAAWRRRERDQSATEGWRYRITWTPVTEPDRAVLSGTWLLVVSAGQAAADLAVGCRLMLEARGARIVVAETATDEAERPVLSALITQILADRAPLSPGG